MEERFEGCVICRIKVVFLLISFSPMGYVVKFCDAPPPRTLATTFSNNKFYALSRKNAYKCALRAIFWGFAKGVSSPKKSAPGYNLHPFRSGCFHSLHYQEWKHPLRNQFFVGGAGATEGESRPIFAPPPHRAHQFPKLHDDRASKKRSWNLSFFVRSRFDRIATDRSHLAFASCKVRRRFVGAKKAT